MTIHVRSSNPEDWRRFLADDGHWRQGFSARSLAHCWHAARGFPDEIAEILKTSPRLSGASVLLAIPEHQVALPGGARPSQTDLWVLARTAQGLASITIEGKVAEPFGPTVGQWLQDASDGKRTRLEALQKFLKLPDPVPKELRYQLLHRTASAILEAHRFCASDAVMLVHSFSLTDEWYTDYEVFVRALGADPRRDSLVPVPGHEAPALHLGWVRGSERFLTA